MKICIYGLGTYELLTESKQNYIGGAEVQQYILAKELNKRKVNVSVIVFDHGQVSHDIVNNINMYKTVPKQYPICGIPSLLKVLLITWKALKTCDSDIYYCRGFGIEFGVIALFCALKNKKFVLGLASDRNVDGTDLKNTTILGKISYLIGFKLADSIICQNENQFNLLKSKFDKNGDIINSMHDSPNNTILKQEPPIVLWVGTIKPEWKQPEIFLNLAREIPYAKFQMIGGPSENIEFYEKIKRDASIIKNVEFVGFVPFPEINEYFSRASIFINTSSVEGFPNTFVQAWMRCVPTVSLNVNPNEVICKYKLGFHSKTYEQMIQDINLLLDNKDLRQNLGKNAHEYAEKEYNVNEIIKKYEQLFNSLIRKKNLD